MTLRIQHSGHLFFRVGRHELARHSLTVKVRQVTKYNKGFCSKHESPLANSGINLYYAVNDARSITERTGDRTAPKASGGGWRRTTT
jgi:hypothetical protein